MANILTRWWERRAAPPLPPLLNVWGGAPWPTAAGVPVDAKTALGVPAVFACCQVLSQDVARTPIRLRQQIDDDTWEDAVDHPLWEILHDLPNPEQSAYQFKAAMEWNLLLYGRAYAEIVRVDGRVVSLWPLDPQMMRVDRTAAPGYVKRWTYGHYSGVYTWLFDASQPPILELVSASPVQGCQDLIGTALALQAFVGAFFKNNAKPAGVIQAAGAISNDTATRLREYWAVNYGGVQNRGKIPVLDGGLEFKTIQSENDSAQLVETQKAIATAICGTFRVPPWKAGLMESTNYSNMQQGELSYVTGTLDPLFQLWEEAIRRDLLTTRQFGMYTAEFDRSALVRSDVKALNDSLSSGIQNGYLSQNDARRALGLNPIPNGDVYMVNSALAPVGKEPANVIA